MALKYFFVLLWLACDKFSSFLSKKIISFTENNISFAQDKQAMDIVKH